MLSSKIICDDTYSNKSWCIVGQACSHSGRSTRWNGRCALLSGVPAQRRSPNAARFPTSRSTFDSEHPNLVPPSYTVSATAPLLQPETATALTGGEWCLPLAYSRRASSHLSPSQLKLWPSVASLPVSQPTMCKPPARTSAAHVQHDEQVVFLCGFRQVTFLSFFSPELVCSAPRPRQPTRLPMRSYAQISKHPRCHKS